MPEKEFRIRRNYQTVIGDLLKVVIRLVIDALERGGASRLKSNPGIQQY